MPKDIFAVFNAYVIYLYVKIQDDKISDLYHSRVYKGKWDMYVIFNVDTTTDFLPPKDLRYCMYYHSIIWRTDNNVRCELILVRWSSIRWKIQIKYASKFSLRFNSFPVVLSTRDFAGLTPGVGLVKLHTVLSAIPMTVFFRWMTHCISFNTIWRHEFLLAHRSLWPQIKRSVFDSIWWFTSLYSIRQITSGDTPSFLIAISSPNSILILLDFMIYDSIHTV